MSELTPLEKLDDAIHTYFQECEHSGDLTSWTLAWQSSRLSSNPDVLPLSFTSSFTMSASTSPETAMGLAHLTAARLERFLVFSEEDDEQ